MRVYVCMRMCACVFVRVLACLQVIRTHMFMVPEKKGPKEKERTAKIKGPNKEKIKKQNKGKKRKSKSKKKK